MSDHKLPLETPKDWKACGKCPGGCYWPACMGGVSTPPAICGRCKRLFSVCKGECGVVVGVVVPEELLKPQKSIYMEYSEDDLLREREMLSNLMFELRVKQLAYQAIIAERKGKS